MSFFELLRKHEGAGNADTLFSHAQKGETPFRGVEVSKMTLGELKEFAAVDGAYGKWVKNKLGEIGHQPRIATPMGVGQIVGTTLRGLQDNMGLGDDVLFDEQTQTAMINELAKRHINLDDKAGTLRGLRGEWEGFKHVSDDELWAAAQGFDGSGATGDFNVAGADRDKPFTGFKFDMKQGADATRMQLQSKFQPPAQNSLSMGSPTSPYGPHGQPGQMMTPSPYSAPGAAWGQAGPGPMQGPMPMGPMHGPMPQQGPQAPWATPGVDWSGQPGPGPEQGPMPMGEQQGPMPMGPMHGPMLPEEEEEVVSQDSIDMGTPNEGDTEEEKVEKQALLDRWGEKLFPNAEDPGQKLKDAIGAAGVAMGQMSTGQTVNLQPYFNSIAQQKSDAAKAVADAEQQRFTNSISQQNADSATANSNISAARLAHDIRTKGGGTAKDYAAIAQTYPELAESGIIQLAQQGDKEAQNQVVKHIGNQLTGGNEKVGAALSSYLDAAGPEGKVAALADLSPEDAKRVVDLAGKLDGGSGSDPAAWETAKLLHQDQPELYASPGAAFKAIKKMEVMGGDTHPDVVKANIAAGSEIQMGYIDKLGVATATELAASQAERAVEAIIEQGSKPSSEGAKTVGRWLANIPGMGSEAKAAFYDAIGYEALADQELTQVQGTMLALIAKDYQGQGEISDKEREQMAKRVISGEMDEVTMMAEIQRMRADAAFMKGDNRYYRQHTNSSNGFQNYADTVGDIAEFSTEKQRVMEYQRNVGQFNYWDTDGVPEGGKKDFMEMFYKDGEFQDDVYLNYIAPPVSENFVRYYADSLPAVRGPDGKPARVYRNYEGEIKYFPIEGPSQ